MLMTKLPNASTQFNKNMQLYLQNFKKVKLGHALKISTQFPLLASKVNKFFKTLNRARETE